MEENWHHPAGYESKEAIQAREQKQAEYKARLQADRAAADKEEQWQKWYGSTPQQRVTGDLWLWVAKYKREHGREPSAEEKQKKESELIAALPSDEDVQKTIFGFVKYPRAEQS